MLASLVLQLRPRKADSLPPSTGPAMHATFLSWIKQFDPDLSATLYGQERLKPFTVSPLYLQTSNPILSTSPQELRLSPTQLFWYRVTSVEERLSQTLLEKLCSQERPEFPAVLGREFVVENVTTEPAEHPWVATDSFENLIALAMGDRAGRNRRDGSGRVSLLFYSPTTSKLNGRLLPLPLPVQTFSSLANRWNNYCPQIPTFLFSWRKGCLSLVMRLKLRWPLRTEVTGE